MFSPGFLQTDQNTTWWIWFLILAVLLLVLIVWWFNRRKDMPPDEPPNTMVQTSQEQVADDLKKIEGIGPKVSNVLNAAGITTFAGLANANSADIQKTLNDAGLQMMNPEGWIEQASLAAKGDWEGLERLQEKLKGGRKT
jgi:hypothetical protein